MNYSLEIERLVAHKHNLEAEIERLLAALKQFQQIVADSRPPADTYPAFCRGVCVMPKLIAALGTVEQSTRPKEG